MAREVPTPKATTRQKDTIQGEEVTVQETSALLQQHLEDCYRVRLETNNTLEALKAGLEPWERVAVFLDRMTGFLAKWGTRLIWTVVTGIIAAYTGILVQGYNAQQSAEKAAQAAQIAQQKADAAATTSATATQKLVRKVDAISNAIGTAPNCGGC